MHNLLSILIIFVKNTEISSKKNNFFDEFFRHKDIFSGKIKKIIHIEEILFHMRNLSERFEVAFNQIQDSLENLLKIYNRGFTDLVRLGSTKHKIIKEFYDELLQYAKLRNAIVHDKIELGYYIAEPHEKVVQRIEHIAKVLSKPNYVLKIATEKVTYFQADDPITKVIQEMKNHSYSKFPIYRNNECIGLLKARTIVKWMADHLDNGNFEISSAKVRDVYLNGSENQILFVPKSFNIFDVEDLFEQAHLEHKKIEMAIITENGKRNETPLGVVTPWDLIEIDYTN